MLGSRKKLLGVIGALAIVCILVAIIVKGESGSLAQSHDAWGSQLGKIKQIPFAALTVPGENGKNETLKYRIFKPSLDLLAIPSEPRDWEMDPLDSFLRFSYTLYCDPNPSYDKYSQSFAEGKKYLDDKFRKLPKYANDEKLFFNNIRASIVDMQLLGEVVCDSVHMFVFAFESSGHKHGCGGVTMIIKDGKFYNDPEAKGRYDVLINMSVHKYREITQHFPEYKVKDE